MDWNSTDTWPSTSKEDSHSISSEQYPVQSEDETPNKKSILGFARTSTYGSQIDDIEERSLLLYGRCHITNCIFR